MTKQNSKWYRLTEEDDKHIVYLDATKNKKGKTNKQD